MLGQVRAVRVHLHDHVVTALQRPAEPGDVSLAQARLFRPVQDLYVRVGLGQLVGDVTGAIRAVVVHHEQVSLRQRGPDPARDRLQVLPLVVGGHDDDRLADRLIGRWVWLSHYLCLSLRWLTDVNHGRAGHDNPVLARPGPTANAALLARHGNEPATRFVPVPRAGGTFLPRKRTRAAPSDRSPSRWQRARPPLSTGCPGPFHAQPPIQPDERPRPVRPDRSTPGLEGGWMRAPPAVALP